MAAQTQSTAGYLLRDVGLIDRPPIEHATIAIRNGRIAAITTGKANPTSARSLHLSGKTLIPGIINAHGHLGVVRCTSISPSNFTGLNIMRQLVQYESYGVTTIVSLGLNKDLFTLSARNKAKVMSPGRLC